MSEGARAGTSSSSRGPRSRLGGACAPGAAVLDACVAHGARVLAAWSVVLGAQSVIFGARSVTFGAQSMVLDAHAAGRTVRGARGAAHAAGCTVRGARRTVPITLPQHPTARRSELASTQTSPKNLERAPSQPQARHPARSSPGGCVERRRQRARPRRCKAPPAPVLPAGKAQASVPKPCLCPSLAPLPTRSSHAAGYGPAWAAGLGTAAAGCPERRGGGARLGDAPAPKAGLAGSRLQEGSSGLTNKLLTASPEAGGRKQALLL